MTGFVQCVNCKNMDLRPVTRQQAANNLASCKLSGLYVMQRLERNCVAFEAAPAEAVQKRDDWINSLKN